MVAVVGTPLDPQLAALAGLSPITLDGQLPYFTGSGPTSAALTTISPVARTVLDETTLPAMVTALGAAPVLNPVFSGVLDADACSQALAPTPTISTGNQIATAGWVTAHFGSLGDYLPLTGGTITGNLTIDPASGGATLTLKASLNTNAQINFNNDAELRWIIYNDVNVESGENVGSNLAIQAYDNAGANPNRVLTAYRDGHIIVDNPPTADDTPGRIATTSWVRDQNYVWSPSGHLSSGYLEGSTTVTGTMTITGVLDANASGNIILVPSITESTDPNTAPANNGGTAVNTAYLKANYAPLRGVAKFLGDPQRDIRPALHDYSDRIPNTSWVTDELKSRLGFVCPEDFPGTDTAMIHGMFSYLASHGGHGVLSRWYTVTDEVDVTALYPFSVTGIGRYISGIIKTGLAGQILDINDAKQITLRSFGLKGNAHPVYTGTGAGLSLDTCSYCVVEDIYVWNWGLGAGIYLNCIGPGCRVSGCHVDGYKNAGNGILMSPGIYGAMSNNLVENICADKTLTTSIQGSPCRALQYKQGISSTITDNITRNCFYNMCINGDNDDVPSENCRIVGGVVSDPSPNSREVAEGSGIYIGDGKSCSAEGVTVDANNQPNFRALQIINKNNAGTSVRFKAVDCNGSGNPRVAYIDAWEADVEIQSMSNFGSHTPVEFAPDSQGCRVRIGQKVGAAAADKMHNPWSYVVNNGNVNNRAENLFDDILFNRIALNALWDIPINDGDCFLITVWTDGSGGENFTGWARISSAPALDSLGKGAEVAIGTTSLSSGGVAGMLNIAAIAGHIHIKNMTSGTRSIAVKLESQF